LALSRDAGIEQLIRARGKALLGGRRHGF
jgi:hypothetical protein